MDKTTAISIAKKYAATVKRKYAFKQMFLFGSFAKGNIRADSDIDIAVVLEDFPNILEMQVELMRLTRGIDSRIEPHPIREKDFTKLNPIVPEILKFGVQVEA